MLLWQTPTAHAKAQAKEGHLRRSFELPVQKGFIGLERLARNLHAFFKTRVQDTQKTIPATNARKDFREFLGYFSEASQGLESPGDNQVPMPSKVDFGPPAVFIEDPESILLGIPKRGLDDPDVSKSERFKRYRLKCGEALVMDERGEVIEIVDWTMASDDDRVGTSVILKF